MLMPFSSALVTGGAGFIGSHLVETLVARGCRVSVLDNFSSGKQANLDAVAPCIRFICGDVRDPAALEAAVSGCEVVFHLAAVVSVPKTTEDPLGSAAVNETGSLQVLETARAAKARRVVFASSSAVYGDEPTLPKREDMPPRPLTPYAVQKLAVEYYLRIYQSLYGLETTGLRFFNVFGPRQDPSSPYSGVISIFITQALRGAPPVIYGDGRQSRDFIYVRDVVEALISAATAPSAPGRVFNVGTGKSVSINSLWERIASLSGFKATPVHQAPRPGDVPRSVAAIDSARADLGFSARVSFGRGLELTMDWYRKSTAAGERMD